MRNKICVIQYSFLPKHFAQMRVAQELGFQVIQILQVNSTDTTYPNVVLMHLGAKNKLVELFTVLVFIFKQRRSLHHLEIYPASYFSAIYTLWARLLGIKVICVERGDLVYYRPKKKGGYNFLIRSSMYLCYKWANVVWYKELFMRPILERMGVKHMFLIHNVVDVPRSEAAKYSDRTIDFLWVNRIVPERKYQWLVKFCNSRKETNNLIVGLRSGDSDNWQLEKKLVASLESNTQAIAFSDPTPYYRQAKYFVLASDLVYLNNALLEAMSYGVVPIISNVSGADLIVTHDIDGWLADHNEESFCDALSRAYQTTESEWFKRSSKTIEKVKTHFSLDYYRVQLKELYKFSESV
ncbi:MAG: hypothetical protein RL660_606 [Bacteroidota bacterium]